jgi:hypothetical protein
MYVDTLVRFKCRPLLAWHSVDDFFEGRRKAFAPVGAGASRQCCYRSIAPLAAISRNVFTAVINGGIGKQQTGTRDVNYLCPSTACLKPIA